MRYRAICLKQPWANLVMEGKKTIETRKWTTKYRGVILICSSQTPKIEPWGCALGTVELDRIEKMEKRHEEEAMCPVYDKAWAWYLKKINKFSKPIPVKGKLGIFEIELEL